MSYQISAGQELGCEFRGPTHVRNASGPPLLQKRSIGQPAMQAAPLFLKFLPEDVRNQRQVAIDSHTSAGTERSLPSPMPPLEAGLPPLPPLPSPEPSPSPIAPPPSGYSASTHPSKTHFPTPKIKRDPVQPKKSPTLPSTSATSTPSVPNSKPFRTHPLPSTGLPMARPNSHNRLSKKKHGGIAATVLHSNIIRGLDHMNRVLGQMRDDIVRNRVDWQKEVVVLKDKVSKLSGRMTRLEKQNAIMRKRHMQYKRQLDREQRPLTFITTQSNRFAVPGSITIAPPILRAVPLPSNAQPLAPGVTPQTFQNFYVSDQNSPASFSGTPITTGLISPMSSMDMDQLDESDDEMFE